MEEQKSQQPRLNRATPVQPRLVQAKFSFSSGSQGTAGAATKAAVAKIESDDDDDEEWSEVSELQEIDLRQLHSYKDQNSNNNAEKRNVGKGKAGGT